MPIDEDVALLQQTPPRGDGPRSAWTRLQAVLGSLLLAGIGHFQYGLWRRGAAFSAVWLTVVIVVGRWSYQATLALALLIGIAAAIDVSRRPGVELDKWSRRQARRIGLTLYAVAVALFLRKFYVESFKIPSGAMIPMLQIGDHIYVDKTGWQPRRGDVIVFIYPVQPDCDSVSRVIGLPGDRISIDEERVTVNGRALSTEPLDEPCSYRDLDGEGVLVERSCRSLDEQLDGRRWRVILDSSGRQKSGEWVMPPGQLFMMGDNRDNSYDSRFWGGVPLANVIGRATIIWNRSTGPDWSPIR